MTFDRTKDAFDETLKTCRIGLMFDVCARRWEEETCSIQESTDSVGSLGFPYRAVSAEDNDISLFFKMILVQNPTDGRCQSQSHSMLPFVERTSVKQRRCRRSDGRLIFLYIWDQTEE